jgi:hypothetical protein
MVKLCTVVSVVVVVIQGFQSFAATSGLWGVNGELWDSSYPSNVVSSRMAEGKNEEMLSTPPMEKACLGCRPLQVE